MNEDVVPPDVPEPAAEATTPAREAPLEAGSRPPQGPPADAGPISEALPHPTAVRTDAASAAAGDGSIADRLADLQQHLERLQQTFDDKLRYDAGREAVIDRLHAELQEYKADLTFKILRPLCLDLIHLHDEVDKLVTAHQAAARSEDAAKLLGLYRTFQADIEAILARYGFDKLITSEPQFDGKRQRVVGTVPTDDPQRDRTIAERNRPGFIYETRIVRPESVTVYVYQPSMQS